MKLNNDDMQISIDEYGQLDSIIDIQNKYEYTLGHPIYSILKDGNTGGLKGMPVKNGVEISIVKNNRSIIVEREFEEQNVTIIDTFTILDDALSWKVKIATNDERQRSAGILIVLAILGSTNSVFLANADAPIGPDDFNHARYVYGADQCRGELRRALSLPLVTIYDSDKDMGISCASPAGMMVPVTWFSLFREKEDIGLVIDFKNLHFGKEHSAEAEVLIKTHGGSWTEGLNWYYERYKKYFSVKKC